jgi:hypothetical protein
MEKINTKKQNFKDYLDAAKREYPSWVDHEIIKGNSTNPSFCCCFMYAFISTSNLPHLMIDVGIAMEKYHYKGNSTNLTFSCS